MMSGLPELLVVEMSFALFVTVTSILVLLCLIAATVFFVLEKYFDVKSRPLFCSSAGG
jgi:hypothetical protein